MEVLQDNLVLSTEFKNVNFVNRWQLFGSTSQSCSWTFIQRSFPGKYKSETDLQVSTVSTRRHALTNICLDVFILWIIV